MNYNYDEQLTCPNCGHQDDSPDELDFGGIEGQAEIECSQCKTLYQATRHVQFSYSTAEISRKYPSKGDEMLKGERNQEEGEQGRKVKFSMAFLAIIVLALPMLHYPVVLDRPQAYKDIDDSPYHGFSA